VYVLEFAATVVVVRESKLTHPGDIVSAERAKKFVEINESDRKT
jgi:hypothetical protein